MKAEVRGPFRITDATGVNRTPKGVKERALLALVLLSPGQRRTRAWLRDKLWSAGNPEQSAVSLRQALANVRKALGPLSVQLGSDRGAVWLEPQVTVTLTDLPAGSELLEDIDIDDPEFDNWLRDLRQGQPSASATFTPDPTRAPTRDVAAAPVVAIVQQRAAQSGAGQFLARALADRIAAGLGMSGDLVILNEEGLATTQASDCADVIIEIETLSEADTWYVLLRTLAQNGKRCVWTGRLRLAMQLSQIWDAPELAEFVNRCVTSTADLVAAAGRNSTFSAIHRAVRRIYDLDRVGLDAADMLLKNAQGGDHTGLALAWRGFVRLTSALEFRDDSVALRQEAISFCDEALILSRDNAVVQALASQVQMNLRGDYDYGIHLAQRAVASDNQSPVALDSFSQAMFFRGDFQGGHEAADLARRAAAGLPHSFSYDMLSCLSELSIGRIEEARAQALSSHSKMPAYRPALRYLVALNLLTSRDAEAAHYTERLRRLEPDFTPHLLLSVDYPVETLRKLGLTQGLRDLLQ